MSSKVLALKTSGSVFTISKLPGDRVGGFLVVLSHPFADRSVDQLIAETYTQPSSYRRAMISD